MAEGAGPVSLEPSAWARVAASTEIIDKVLSEHRIVYGVNTGFGILARQRIADADVTELQRRLVVSHAVGTGPLLEDARCVWCY